jgi:hypothetical protein
MCGVQLSAIDQNCSQSSRNGSAEVIIRRISNMYDLAKGTEVFEAFGMKFPSAQVTWWGIFLLLSIQIYFLTYLRSLYDKLQPDDPGWDVPWIGMDQSTLSKRIFFFTLVLLPCMAVALLAGHRVWQLLDSGDTTVHSVLENRGSDFSGLFTWLKFLSFTTLFLAAVLLARLSWKYRPRVVGEESRRSLSPMTSEKPSPQG